MKRSANEPRALIQGLAPAFKVISVELGVVMGGMLFDSERESQSRFDIEALSGRVQIAELTEVGLGETTEVLRALRWLIACHHQVEIWSIRRFPRGTSACKGYFAAGIGGGASSARRRE